MNVKDTINNILNNEFILLAARIIIGLIFIFASIAKITDPATFAKEINNYGIVPFYFTNIMSLVLPWVELICGIFLISGVRLKSSSAISVVLYIIFTVAVGIALIKGLNITCGCHTKITAENVGVRKIIENTGLLILCLYIFFYPAKKFTLEQIAFKENNNEIKSSNII